MKIRFNQPENKIPNDDRGLRIRYSDAKRPGRPWRWYLILVIASFPLIYLLGLIAWERMTVEANGRIRVANFIVRAPVDGYIQRISAEPLQMVSGGAHLAQLVNSSLQESHDRIQAEIDWLEKEQQKWMLQAEHARFGSMRLIKYAREQKDFLHKRLRQYETLFAQGAATQAEVATMRNQYNSALENSVRLEQAYHREQSPAPEMLHVSNQMNQRTLELEKIRDQIKQLTLVAPAEGLIAELFAQPGEYLARGQALFEIIFPDKVYVDAFIPPKYQDYAVAGRTVSVKFPNGETAKAKIIGVPGVMRKSSAEEANPLEVVRSAILAQMEFIGTVENRIINGMPVTIYFD